jgi:hypothetical protein
MVIFSIADLCYYASENIGFAWLIIGFVDYLLSLSVPELKKVRTSLTIFGH